MKTLLHNNLSILFLFMTHWLTTVGCTTARYVSEDQIAGNTWGLGPGVAVKLNHINGLQSKVTLNRLDPDTLWVIDNQLNLVPIPRSKILSVEYRKFSPGKTVALGATVGITMLGILTIATLSSPSRTGQGGTGKIDWSEIDFD